MRIITLRVIWLPCSGALSVLEVTIIGNAVSDCEATVGGCRYDGTLMEEPGRRLCVWTLGIDPLSERSMSAPPVSQRLGTAADNG